MAQSLQIHTNSAHPALFPLSSSHRLSPFQIPYCRRHQPLGYLHSSPPAKFSGATCCSEKPIGLRSLKTCKFCKTQFDPSANHPRACRFHTAHFGGETKRKFESVYTGGTMNTPNSGQVLEYWHCCGSEDPFDPGCTASPHTSYDD